MSKFVHSRLPDFDADDAIQNTWLKADHAFHDVIDPQKNFVSWIMTIASREVHQLYRQKKTQMLGAETFSSMGYRTGDCSENNRNSFASNIPNRPSLVDPLTAERLEWLKNVCCASRSLLMRLLNARYYEDKSLDELAREFSKSPSRISTLLGDGKNAVKKRVPSSLQV